MNDFNNEIVRGHDVFKKKTSWSVTFLRCTFSPFFFFVSALRTPHPTFYDSGSSYSFVFYAIWTCFIDPFYNLDYINKAYQIQFHPLRNEDYWSTYTSPNFIPDPQTRRKASERPTTTRIHNEMDQPITDKPKKMLLLSHWGSS